MLFRSVPEVGLQNLAMPLTRNTPAELEIEVPPTFPRPKLTDEALVILIENPDTQKYGFRIPPSLFYPPALNFANDKDGGRILSSSNGATNTDEINTVAGVETSSLLLFPNPARELLTLEIPFDLVLVGNLAPHRVSVIDTRGVTVLTMFVPSSEWRISVPIANLGSGAYSVELLMERRILRGRFVKQ